MKRLLIFTALVFAAALLVAQNDARVAAPFRNERTMRPVIRGSVYAVSSRTPQATQVADRILRAGGNAFDAAVAGQAALGVTDPAMNGVGADACILVYDVRAGKVVSLNAEGTAPKLATIEWYKKNAGGKIPANDTLLSASLPCIVDA